MRARAEMRPNPLTYVVTPRCPLVPTACNVNCLFAPECKEILSRLTVSSTAVVVYQHVLSCTSVHAPAPAQRYPCPRPSKQERPFRGDAPGGAALGLLPRLHGPPGRRVAGDLLRARCGQNAVQCGQIAVYCSHVAVQCDQSAVELLAPHQRRARLLYKCLLRSTDSTPISIRLRESCGGQNQECGAVQLPLCLFFRTENTKTMHLSCSAVTVVHSPGSFAEAGRQAGWKVVILSFVSPLAWLRYLLTWLGSIFSWLVTLPCTT